MSQFPITIHFCFIISISINRFVSKLPVYAFIKVKKKIKYPYNSDKNCASCSKNFSVDERCQISIVNFRKKFVNFSGKNEETYLSEEILGHFYIDFLLFTGRNVFSNKKFLKNDKTGFCGSFYVGSPRSSTLKL